MSGFDLNNYGYGAAVRATLIETDLERIRAVIREEIERGSHPASEATEKQSDLTEVCQVYGKPLYVRLDWRDSEKAKYELDQIRSALTNALMRDTSVWLKG